MAYCENSFRPSQEIRMMRTYWTTAGMISCRVPAAHPADAESADANEYQLVNVLSDVSGVTGQAIIKPFWGANAIRIS